jgi:hypothetical protein
MPKIPARRAREMLFPVKGTGFSPYIKPARLTGALAPEGFFAEELIISTPISRECKAG